MITASNKKSHGGNHELSRSELYYQAHNPASKIYQALETIKILQNTDKYETFSSRESFLYELSKDIVQYLPSNHYKDYVDMAVKQYKQTYKTNIITRRQQEFIENPDIKNNHSFTAKLKARFFADFCEAMQSEINRLKTEKAKQKRRDHVKEVALSIIEYLKTNNHILLANGIVDDAAQLGVEIDKNLI